MTTRTESKARKPAHGGAVKKARALVRRAASGTLLAASLAATQIDADATTEKWPVFSPRMIDRLRAPITRYHD